MRVQTVVMVVGSSGSLACAIRSGEIGESAESTESQDESSGSSSTQSGTGPECEDNTDCPPNTECSSLGECEPYDEEEEEPCDCSADETCVAEECLPLEALPPCVQLESVGSPSIVPPEGAFDQVIAEFDALAGVDLVGVSSDSAITWSAGVQVESPLDLPEDVQIAALHATDDAWMDVVVATGVANRLITLAGDGAGGFSIADQRDLGLTVRGVARMRTAPGVDGMFVHVTDFDYFNKWVFLNAATSSEHELEFEGYFEPSLGDLDGDGVDELFAGVDEATALLAIDAGDWVHVASLSNRVGGQPSKGMCTKFLVVDLDTDGDNDLVCVVNAYAGSEYNVLRPFISEGGFTVQAGDPVLVVASGERLQAFDLDGDGSPELLLDDAVVDVGPDGTLLCSSSHQLGRTIPGDLDGDGSDELAGWQGERYDLSW